jgi:probable rRNA maturation factor
LKLDLVVDEAARPWRPEPDWEENARALVARAGPTQAVLEVILTGDATLQELNRRYRGKDASTDVLSFSNLTGHEAARESLLRGTAEARPFADEPHPVDDEDFLVGQVYISLDTVRARPPRGGRDVLDEVLFLIAHGLLHVLGYDHVEDDEASEMESREQELLVRSGVRPHATAGGEGS